MFRIGVDVGSTNTDAVLLRNHEILETVKSPTSENVTDGMTDAIGALLARRPDCARELQHISVGTTHFVNAVLQRRGLVRVAVLRLGAPCAGAVPPLTQFPAGLAAVVRGPWHTAPGGINFDGRPITEPNEAAVKSFAVQCANVGCRHMVVVAVFSPVSGAHEEAAAAWIREVCPDMELSLSHRVGQLGLLTRENVTILNETLKPLARRTISALRAAMGELGLSGVPLFLTQNNGTLLSLRECLQTPVLTFNSGTTNSMRGARFLCGPQALEWPQAIVVDIGGTSTDAGLLINGFPKPSAAHVLVAGVPTTFQAPEIVSVALGGGTKVQWSEDGHAQLGPTSVGLRLSSEALVFGGNTVTFTDIAVANDPRLTHIGCRDRIEHLSLQAVAAAMTAARERLQVAVAGVRVSAEEVPLLLVGGGAALFSREDQIDNLPVLRPKYGEVANAVGAALAQVSASCDKVVDLGQNRSETIERLIAELRMCAVTLGADPESVFLAEKEEIGLPYLPGAKVRLRLRMIGDLMAKGTAKEVKEESEEQFEPPEEACEAHGPMRDAQEEEELQESAPLLKEGSWHLSKFDVRCIALGTIFLGCGGGGDPEELLLRVEHCLDKGRIIRVMTPEALLRANPQALVLNSQMMGSPLIGVEKSASDAQLWSVLLAQLAEPHLGPELETTESGVFQATLPQLEAITATQGLTLNLNDSNRDLNLVTFEIGGMNGLSSLLLSALTGGTAVDADFMGRAFPELQMTSAYIAGVSPTPAQLADEFGTCLVTRVHRDAKALEGFFRTHCLAMGCLSAVGFAPLTAAQLNSVAIPHSLSRAFHIGREILRQRRNGSDVGEGLRALLNGELLIEGKIVDVNRATVAGFARGHFVVRGASAHAVVHLQNEFLLARRCDSEGVNEGEVLATTPNLIVIMETSNGQPLQTSDIRYGLSVRVYAFPAPPQMCTPQALKVVGPEAFGFSGVQFKTIGDFVALPVVC